ncbi:YopX family protein [Streptococcus suis]
MIPKFRVWDTFEEDMVNDIFFSWQDCGYESLNECLSDERWKLMQSTGLFDKNGKEIFEDDVVKLKYTVLSDYEFFKVTRFRGGSWRIDNRQRGSELWLRNEDCEIIGNIHQNPELVEATND